MSLPLMVLLAVPAAAMLGCATPSASASPSTVPAVPLPACPPRLNTASGPVGSSPLEVWRSRAELPGCISPGVPTDFDFTKEMLAGNLSPLVAPLELKAPARPPLILGEVLVIEEQEQPRVCPECRGAVDLHSPVPVRPPTQLWRLRRVDGVAVFHRSLPHPFSQPCPPCTAP